MSRGRLEAIWVKKEHGGPMESRKEAEIRGGVVGDVNEGGHRQVTVIEKEVWRERTDRLGVEVDPSARRANFMVSGCALLESRGRVLVVGEVRIRIQGETRPCSIMDEAAPGLRDALDPGWGAGAYGEVIRPGRVRLGDPVSWVAPEEGSEESR
jgi:MOSC domain-containing protein YiiM